MARDRLQANVTQAAFLRSRLEQDITRLQADRGARLAKANEVVQSRPAVLPTTAEKDEDHVDQVSAFTGLALLSFVAALGFTCACATTAPCFRRRRLPPVLDDRPPECPTPELSEEDRDIGDTREPEVHPWRPLRESEEDSPLRPSEDLPEEAQEAALESLIGQLDDPAE